MKIAVLAFTAALSAATVAAAPLAVGDRLSVPALADQFDQPLPVTADTALMLFATDMDGNRLANDALQAAAPNCRVAPRVVYVADISGMPALVSRFIALPKMRERPYRIALDRSGTDTAALPREPGRVTLLHLQGLRVTQLQTGGAVELQQAIAGACLR